MDRHSEKSSRKYRDDRDKERESTDDHRDRDGDRDRKHHRTRKDGEDEDRHRSDKHRLHRLDRDSRREGSHELRDDRDNDRRVKREKSHELRDADSDREELAESSKSHKRKDRGDSEDRYESAGEKKIRGSGKRRFEDKDEIVKDVVEKEGRREKRKSDDCVISSDANAGNEVKGERRERRRFGDKVKAEQDFEGFGNGNQLFSDNIKVKKEETVDTAPSNGRGLIANAAVEPLNMASKTIPSVDPVDHHNTKASSVHGKSSTDGTLPPAPKSESLLTRDALAKAKKVLQMQNELSEKMKKIRPLLNKGASSSLNGGLQVGFKAAVKAPPPPPTASTSTTPSLPGLTIPNLEAVKRAHEVAFNLGFVKDPEFGPLINMFPGQVSTEVMPSHPKPAKAPVLRLDPLGREIDEHGNLVNLTKPNSLSTLKVNINKKKREAFQILKPELEVDPLSNPHFDERMGIDKMKLLRPKRMTFQFVEEGKWAKEAENLKLKSQFGEAQAKELKAKQAQLAKAKAEPDINPNLIEVSERIIIKEKPKDPIPEVEWWDVPLLQNGKYGNIVDDATIPEDKLKMEKITIYIEHPCPIEPPAEPAPPPPQPLKLTKKELKKLRTQTRLAREKQKQEMIRDGVLQPPKQKVKMSNLMKVLGSEATQDPTRLEMEVRSAAAEREQAHVDRNIARKSTPAEKREKKERKLFDDPNNTLETTVSVYKINNLSHPQTRFKVDINAQENRLTGCAVISEGISVVVVEGGIKSIKRYGKLMLKRINWAAAVAENPDDDDMDEETKGVNKCVLAWQGSVAKPSFNRFTVHNCRTEAAARKVLADAGVIHYWDLAANYQDDQF